MQDSKSENTTDNLPVNKENESDSIYDYDGYTKSLEKILDGVTKEYWASYVDIVRHQVSISRTYLWVSVTLIGSYAATYSKFGEQLLNNSCLTVLSFVAFILSSLAFGLCLYGIPARKGYQSIPVKGWGEFSLQAHNYLSNKHKRIYSIFLADLISRIDNAFAHNFATNIERAKLLRLTSWLLIISFTISLFITASLAIGKLTKSNTGEIKMSEQSKDNAQSSNSSEKLEIPTPPPSADISKITNAGRVHAFDSANKVTTHLTEGLENKGK
jgi:FtsH-binding integral membrane protein